MQRRLPKPSLVEGDDKPVHLFQRHQQRMWPNYNSEEAARCLHSNIVKASQEAVDESPLSHLQLGAYAVAQVQNSRAYKIVSRTTPDEELVVKVIGVVCSKTLPPFRGTLDNTSAIQRRKVRQYVKLCGAGAQAFDEYESHMNSIVNFFAGSVGSNRIEAPELGLFDGQYAIDFHTRYFEERRFAPDVAHIPFDEIVDPNGTLERARGTELVHGEQNIVEYCVKTYEESGIPQYHPLPPQEFAISDIVEICGTFTLYPYRTDDNPSVRFKLVNGLRTLSLVNHDFAKAMKQAGVARATRSKKFTVSVPKRKYLAKSLPTTGNEETRPASRQEDMDED